MHTLLSLLKEKLSSLKKQTNLLISSLILYLYIMTLNDFVKKYNNKATDFDKQYGPQCVDLFNQYLVDCLGILNPIGMFSVASAYQIWDLAKDNSKFERIENSPTNVPQAGDIIIWNQGVGPHGHVAIFLSGGVMDFKSFDQNWNGVQRCIETTHSYNNIIGWLRPVKETVAPSKPPFVDLVNLWKNMEGNKTYAAVLGMFLSILAYNLGYITEEQFNMFDTLFLALMGFSLRDAIKKK